MSIVMTWQSKSENLGETESLGSLIGSNLKGGEVIELISDLGGGKTAFVRGLAKGAGSSDAVASPSFTISREYQTSNFTIYHFDFYRLADPGIIANELAELINDSKAVVVVEWAEIVEDVLPSDKFRIYIGATGENSRDINFEFPESLQYLIPKEQLNVDTDN